MIINKKNIVSYTIVLLSVTVLALMFKSYKDNKKATDIQYSLNQETILTQNQLSEMLKKYDTVMVMYKSLEKTVSANATSSNNLKIPNNIDLSNPENKNLVNNQILNIKDSIKSLNLKLKSLENIKTSFNKSNSNKFAKTTIEKLNKNNKIQLSNVQARGVKILNDNSTGKKKDIEQIRVCFTLDSSLGLAKGDKELYIQIVNPKNTIITSNGNSFQAENSVLLFSKKALFYYDQQATDVCNYVDIPKNRIAKGRYLINIYEAGNKIGSTIFYNN